MSSHVTVRRFFLRVNAERRPDPSHPLRRSAYATWGLICQSVTLRDDFFFFNRFLFFFFVLYANVLFVCFLCEMLLVSPPLNSRAWGVEVSRVDRGRRHNGVQAARKKGERVGGGGGASLEARHRLRLTSLLSDGLMRLPPLLFFASFFCPSSPSPSSFLPSNLNCITTGICCSAHLHIILRGFAFHFALRFIQSSALPLVLVGMKSALGPWMYYPIAGRLGSHFRAWAVAIEECVYHQAQLRPVRIVVYLL